MASSRHNPLGTQLQRSWKAGKEAFGLRTVSMVQGGWRASLTELFDCSQNAGIFPDLEGKAVTSRNSTFPDISEALHPLNGSEAWQGVWIKRTTASRRGAGSAREPKGRLHCAVRWSLTRVADLLLERRV